MSLGRTINSTKLLGQSLSVKETSYLLVDVAQEVYVAQIHVRAFILHQKLLKPRLQLVVGVDNVQLKETF